MKIDTHQHVFWHGKDDAGLVADLDEQGIDIAWLLTWEIPSEEDDSRCHGLLNPQHFREDGTHGGIVFEDILQTCNKYSGRFIAGYCPDPRNEGAAAVFEAAYRMHKVRVCGEWKFRMLIDDPRCLNLFRKAGELKCPVVLHLDVPYLVGEEGGMEYDPRWYGGTVENLSRALEACAQTVFIGHGPGFWREISGDADEARTTYPEGPVTPGGRLGLLFEKYDNFYADLSAGSGRVALMRDADHAAEFLTRYADRLLFARDFYGGALDEFMQTLDLSDDVKQAIYHDNAARLISLDEVIV